MIRSDSGYVQDEICFGPELLPGSARNWEEECGEESNCQATRSIPAIFLLQNAVFAHENCVDVCPPINGKVPTSPANLASRRSLRPFP